MTFGIVCVVVFCFFFLFVCFFFLFFLVFFFFQAEDGIRDRDVTGVRRVLFRSPGFLALQMSIFNKYKKIRGIVV